MTSFTDCTPREVDLLEAISSRALTQDDDSRLKAEDKRLLRKLYKRGLILAEPVLWVDGPVHDNLMIAVKGQEVVDSIVRFRAELPVTNTEAT